MSVANGSTVVRGSGAKGFVAILTDSEDGSSLTSYLLARLMSWSVSCTIGTDRWADSDSSGYLNTIPTNRDATGTIAGALDNGGSGAYKAYARFLFHTSGNYPYQNDMVALVLYEDGDEATPTDYWLFKRAAITSYDQTVDQGTKEHVEWTANFESDGQFWLPGEHSPALTYGDLGSVSSGGSLDAS